MKNIGTPAAGNREYNEREDFQKNLVRKLEGIKKKTALGGGEKSN